MKFNHVENATFWHPPCQTNQLLTFGFWFKIIIVIVKVRPDLGGHSLTRLDKILRIIESPSLTNLINKFMK